MQFPVFPLVRVVCVCWCVCVCVCECACVFILTLMRPGPESGVGLLCVIGPSLSVCAVLAAAFLKGCLGGMALCLLCVIGAALSFCVCVLIPALCVVRAPCVGGEG